MIKRILIPYIFTSLITAFSVYSGIYLSSNQDTRIFFVIVVPIILFFLTDKITSLLQSSQDLKDLEAKINQSIPQYGAIVTFENSQEAFNYICQAFDRAQTVYNTKISMRNDINLSFKSTQRKFTKALKKNLKRGLNYSVVATTKYRSSIEELETYVTNQKTAGKIRSKIVVNSNLPHLNFTVIEFDDNDREILLGWTISENWDHTNPIFLIKDLRLANYFLKVHNKWMS